MPRSALPSLSGMIALAAPHEPRPAHVRSHSSTVDKEYALQDATGKPLRLANKPQLKRLQGKSTAEDQQQAQPVVAGSAQDDALIEKDLAQMKADRLKRIQALPSTVWS